MFRNAEDGKSNGTVGSIKANIQGDRKAGVLSTLGLDLVVARKASLVIDYLRVSYL